MIQFRVRYGQLRAQLDRARRRLAAARALWLALCVPLAALALRLANGPSIAAGWVAWASAIVFAGAAFGPWVRRPADEARALDRRFGLDELLVTAVEVDARGPRTPLEDRLLDDAAGRLLFIRSQPSTEPVRLRIEVETAAALALILAGGTILTDSVRAPVLPPARDAVGWSTTGAGRDAPAMPNGGGVPGAAERAMAGALRDQAMAEPLVGALSSGDPKAAALALRTLADQTRELSPAGKRDMADALQEASRAIAPLDRTLADAAAAAAAGLRQATPPADAEGLRSLADVLASQAQRAPRAGTAALPMGTAASRLSAAVVPRGIATGRPGAFGAVPSNDGRPAADRLVEPAPVRGGGAVGARSAADGGGSVPLAERETVRRYFARTGADDPVGAER